MNMRLNALKKQEKVSQKKYTNMKISELIEKLEDLKSKYGDLIVTVVDEEGPFEIQEAYQTRHIIYDGRKEGPYDTQLAVRIC